MTSAPRSGNDNWTCNSLSVTDDERAEHTDRATEGSMTWDPLVVWGAWVASRHSEDPAPMAWVVLGLLLGVPTLLALAVVLVVVF